MNKFFFALFFTFLSLKGWAQTLCPIIPAPHEATVADGIFKLDTQTPVVADAPGLEDAVQYLQQALLRLKALPLARLREAGGRPAIRLGLQKDLLPEGYTLKMEPQSVRIAGGNLAGVINGISSLLQLVAPGQAGPDGSMSVRCWRIADQPAYTWRGLMLDESRHFIGKEKLLSLIDWMAFYKLNRLHWHLTDEPAWRLEIRKYPKLALIGGVGDYQDPKRPAAFYSQQDIGQIVDYAAKRNILIIPEIDMPGHATAAIRAYPEYNGGGSAQHPDFTFDPGKGPTYTFLSNILRETNAMFPSGMLHLGGDEVSFGTENWLKNEGIRNLISQHHLNGLKGVERYFMERMADSVYAMDAKLLVWDEMADINLPKDKTIIFWWRHDKPEQLTKALSKGYSLVLCPRLPFYFDFVQDSTHRAGRKWGGHFSLLQDVYQFRAGNVVTDGASLKQVLGIQANLWTETVTNDNRLDYLLFPRIAALAEAAWSADEVKDYSRFKAALLQQFPLYRQGNVYFYNPFNPGEIPEPVYFKKDRVDLNAKEN